jgi:hypothetical protein
MWPFARSLSLPLGLAVALTGCVRSQTSMSAMPSTLHVDQICPGATYLMVSEFEKSWTGWGFMGFPFSAGPNVASYVNEEVWRLGGDAAIDVMLRTHFTVRSLYIFWQSQLPGYSVSGKVIRYTDTNCLPEEETPLEELPSEDPPSTPGGPNGAA